MLKKMLLTLAVCATLSVSCTAAAADQPAAPAPVIAQAPAATASFDNGPFKLLLKTGDRLAIVGDSITEQRRYSRFIEDYLTACTPQLDLWIIQLGWSGEEAVGLVKRMDMDLLSFKPTVFTTCYGMNDGGYRAFAPSIGDNYLRNMKEIVTRGKAAGARVVVGSPGAVDTQAYKGKTATPEVYNDNLAHLKEIARTLAAEQGQSFADVHDDMIAAMGPAKEKLGKDYPVCGGRDGFHPDPNGHLVMAYAFLRAMGLDGNVGAITLDAAAGKAEATDGHKVLSFKDGTAEIESTRYPFCFTGDDKSEDGTRSILPFLPFNRDLNRLTLTVTGLKSARAKVTWGQATKTYTREQLAKGINLADEFVDGNPFADAFKAVDDKVAAKQLFETSMVKGTYHTLAGIQSSVGDDAETAAAIKTLVAKLAVKQDALRKGVKDAVVPVKHTIKIEAE